MDLSNAEKWTTVYCLTNTPDAMINDMIYREGFNWKDNEIPDWKKLEIINNNIYDEENFFRLMELNDCKPNIESEEKHVDIFNNFVPMSLSERIIEKEVERHQSKIDEMHERVLIAREELIKLEKDGH